MIRLSVSVNVVTSLLIKLINILIIQSVKSVMAMANPMFVKKLSVFPNVVANTINGQAIAIPIVGQMARMGTMAGLS
jgi:hypothetical protein